MNLTNSKHLEEIQKIFGNAPIVLTRWRYDKEKNKYLLEFVSDSISIFGYTPEEFYSQELEYNDIIYKKDKQNAIDESIEIIQRGKNQYIQTYRVITKDNEIRWVEDHSTIERDNDGTPVNAHVVLLDITETKKAQIETKKKNKFFQEFIEYLQFAIMIVNNNDKVEYINPQFTNYFGYTLEEIPNISTWRKLAFPDEIYRRKMKKNWEKEITVIDNKNIPIRSVKYQTKSGDIIYTKNRALNFDEAHKILIFEDITEEIKIRNDLADEKERLLITMQSIADGIITCDNSQRINYINPTAEKLTEWNLEEAKGKIISEVFHVIDEKTKKPINNLLKLNHSVESSIEVGRDILLLSRTGKKYVISFSSANINNQHGESFGTITVFQDITEKRKLEEDFYKSQKIESVGTLAGGIAHDFNNILTSILGNLSLARMEVGEEIPEAFNILQEAEQATIRAKNLTNQLLTFSKGGSPIKNITSIEKIVKKTASFVLRGSQVTVDYQIPSNLWKVKVDEGQISQVINNMVLNAVQAMPRGGLLKIHLENTLEVIDSNNGHHKEPYLQIMIQDNGIGIPSEHLAKIFDPYFTTKESGNGLGLAVCYSIIKNHGGKILVESKVNNGTRFDIYLPAIPHAQLQSFEQDQSQLAEIPHGDGKVLILEDDLEIQKMLGSFLQKLGYSPKFTQNGYDAIETFERERRQGKPFDVLLMDLTVPGGMGAKEVLKYLHKASHNLKAIVMSGYANNEVIQNYQDYGFTARLVKPFTLEKLGMIMDGILNKK